MKLIIEIDEEDYNFAKREVPDGRIANGIPLPKGHGRLGDLDALQKEVSSWGMNDYEPSDFIDVINEADTIIEPDTESEDKECR